MAASFSQKIQRGRILSHDPYSTRSNNGSENNGLHIFTTAKQNQVFHFDTTEQLPWEQRKERMNQAIAWITSEVAFMKVQDKMLTNQFSRCQKVIGQLKLRKLREQQQRRKWSAASNDSILQDGLWEDWEIEEFDASESSGDSGDSDTENFKLTAAEKKTKRSRSCDDILNSSTEIHDNITISKERFIAPKENVTEGRKEDKSVKDVQDHVVDCPNTAQQTNGLISANTPVDESETMAATESQNNTDNSNNATDNNNPNSLDETNGTTRSNIQSPFEENSNMYSEEDDTELDDSDGPLSSTLDDIIIDNEDDVPSVGSSSIESLVNHSLQYVAVDEDGYISFDMSLDNESSYAESDKWSINGDDAEENTDNENYAESGETFDTESHNEDKQHSDNDEVFVNPKTSDHNTVDKTETENNTKDINAIQHNDNDAVFIHPGTSDATSIDKIDTYNNTKDVKDTIQYVKHVKYSLSPPRADKLNTSISPTRDIWILYV